MVDCALVPWLWSGEANGTRTGRKQESGDHVTIGKDGRKGEVVLLPLPFELSEESQEDASERLMVSSGIV